MPNPFARTLVSPRQLGRTSAAALAFLATLGACTETRTPTAPTAPPHPAFAVSSPAATWASTSTGFYYPLGRGQPLSVKCGTWLGRDKAHGGCYLDTLYHIGFDNMGAIGDSVYAIAQGVVLYRSNDAASWGATNSALYVLSHLSDGSCFVWLAAHIHTGLNTGDQVTAGAEIGSVGPYPTGNHVHLGVHPGCGQPSSPTGNEPNTNWGTANETNGFVDPINWIETRVPQCQNGTSERYIPTGLSYARHPDGSIVKTASSQAVFVLVNGQRRWIPTLQRLWELYGPGRGFDIRDVITISQAEMNSYPWGADVTGPLPWNGRNEPDGRLIRQWGGTEVALVSNGYRRPFTTWKAFIDLGYAACNIAGVSDYASYPYGTPISQ